MIDFQTLFKIGARHRPISHTLDQIAQVVETTREATQVMDPLIDFARFFAETHCPGEVSPSRSKSTGADQSPGAVRIRSIGGIDKRPSQLLQALFKISPNKPELMQRASSR